MPGLGDALSKAFEDSMHDIDALVEKAAQEEAEFLADEAAESMEAAASEPAPESEPEPARPESPSPGLDRVEKATLLSASDPGLEGLGDPLADSESVAPPAEEDTEPAESGRIERTQGETAPADMADEALRSAVDATRILEDAVPPGPAADPETATKTVELPAAQTPPAQPTSVTMSEPVAPFAQFAASGIIRRKIRRDVADEVAHPVIPEPVPAPQEAPSEPPAEVAPQLSGTEAQDQVLDPVPQAQTSGEDVLAVCRRLMVLEGAEDHRIPLLLEGVEGLVRAMTNGEMASPGLVAVCGSSEHSGASTIAAGCALKLAEDRNKRVLLIDADFRAPSVARMAGKSGSGPDLKDVLTGEATLSEAILYSPNENLAILPIYGWGEGTDEALAKMVPLLEKENADRLMELLRSQFDYVVFDAGSAIDWEGPIVLAGAAGSAVMVVRAGRITAKTAMVLKKNLERAGSRLEGSLLTFA